jgi:hypothetical protein
MRVGNPVAYATFGILTALALLAPGRAHGQAPPGPLPRLNSQPGQQTPEPQPESPPKPKPPAVQPRATLAGRWRLNGDQSDDPRQRVRVAELTTIPAEEIPVEDIPGATQEVHGEGVPSRAAVAAAAAEIRDTVDRTSKTIRDYSHSCAPRTR